MIITFVEKIDQPLFSADVCKSAIINTMDFNLKPSYITKVTGNDYVCYVVNRDYTAMPSTILLKL